MIVDLIRLFCCLQKERTIFSEKWTKITLQTICTNYRSVYCRRSTCIRWNEQCAGIQCPYPPLLLKREAFWASSCRRGLLQHCFGYSDWCLERKKRPSFHASYAILVHTHVEDVKDVSVWRLLVGRWRVCSVLWHGIIGKLYAGIQLKLPRIAGKIFFWIQ